MLYVILNCPSFFCEFPLELSFKFVILHSVIRDYFLVFSGEESFTQLLLSVNAGRPLHSLSLILITLLIVIITAVQKSRKHQQDLYGHHYEHYDEEHQDEVTHQVECLGHLLTVQKLL